MKLKPGAPHGFEAQVRLDPVLLRAFRLAWEGDLRAAEAHALLAADRIEAAGDAASARNLRALLDTLTGRSPSVYVLPNEQSQGGAPARTLNEHNR